MVVSLYSTNDPINKVDKTLTDVRVSVACQVKSPLDLYNPTIVLSLPDNVGDFNYCKIDGKPFNGRYYFVKPYTASANKLVTIPLECDVLSSNKDSLRQLSAIIERQESEGNLYIPDGSFPVENRNEIFYKEFANGFEQDFTYYLTIGG